MVRKLKTEVITHTPPVAGRRIELRQGTASIWLTDKEALQLGVKVVQTSGHKI